MGSTFYKPPTSGDMLDIDGAADYLGASPRWVREQVATRRITFVKLGRLVRFRRTDLDAYIDAHIIEAQP